MAPTAAAMELKVLISVLQSGTALQGMLAQVNQLSQALTNLQNKAAIAGAAAGAAGGAGGAAALGALPAATAAAAQLTQATGQAAAGVAGAGNAAGSAAPQMLTLAAAMNQVIGAARFLAGGFLAFESVRFIKNIADVAARTQVLDTVLKVVAVNAGVTEEEIEKVSKGVQRLGITAQSANQSLTQFLQAGLKIQFAEPLARAAQDLAVVSGMDSSQTFQRMLLNIQQLDTMGLRWMGIVVSRTEAEAKFAAKLDITADALNQRQKQEALLMAVLEKARGLEGAYEAAMGDVGKQMTSLVRYTQDLRTETGKFLLPAYSAIISELSLFLAKMQDLAVSSAQNTDAAESFGETVRRVARSFFGVIETLVEYRKAIYALVSAYLAYRTVVLVGALWTGLINTISMLTTTVLTSVAAIRTATTATYAWIVALGLLQTVQGSAAATGGTQLAFDFMKPGQAGALTAVTARMRELMTGVRALTGVMGEAGIVSGTLARVWAFMAGSMKAVVAVVASVEGILVALVAVIAGLFAITLAYTKAGTEANSAFTKSIAIFGELFKIVATLTRGFVELGTAIATGTLPYIRQFVDWLGKLAAEQQDQVGSPVYMLRVQFQNLNTVLDFTLTKLREVRIAMEQFFGIKPEAANTKELADKLTDLDARLARAREIQTEAQNEAVKARRAGILANTQAAEAEYKRVSDDVKAIQKEKDAVIEDARKKDPASLKAAQEQADRNKKTKEFRDAIQAADEARERLLQVNVKDGEVTSKQLDAQVGSIKTLIDAYVALQGRIDLVNKGLGETDEKAADLQKEVIDTGKRAIEGARAAFASVRTPDDLKKFEKAMEDLKARGIAQTPEDLSSVNAAVAAARINVRDRVDPAQAVLISERKNRLEILAKQSETYIQIELDQVKNRNEQQEALDKEAYEIGLIGIETYYRQRRERLSQEQVLELQIAAAQVKAARDEQIAGVARTPKERADLQLRLTQAQAKLQQTEVRAATSQEALSMEEFGALRQLDQAMKTMRLETAAAYGSEAEALAVITNRYEQQAIQLKALGEEKALQALAGKEQLEVEKTQAAFRQQALDRDLQQTTRKQQALSIEQSLLNVERMRVDAGQKTGLTTESEGIAQRNALLLKQIAIDRRNLAILEEELARKNLELERTTLIVLEEQARAQGDRFDPNSVATLEAIRKATQGLETDTAALGARVVETNGKILTALSDMETYGMKFQKVFGDSFAKLLEDMAFSVKKSGELLRQFGETLGRNVIAAQTKNIAERAARSLANIGAKRDEEGKVIPGTGLFEKLFPFLGKEKADGSSKDKALWVQFEQKLVGTGPGGAPGAPGIQNMPGIGDLFNVPGVSAPGGVGETVGKLAPVIDTFIGQLFKKRMQSVVQLAGGVGGAPAGLFGGIGVPSLAGGGVVTGPGTGTSDSVPILASAGEHVMPAARVQTWLPVLEGIRLGKILPYSTGGVVQSIAPSSIIPRRYANGGVVVSDGGAASVQPGGGGGPSNMVVTMHPDTLNMTMREWLEHEVVRQHGRR